MSTFRRCDKDVDELAADLMRQFETHSSLIEQKVRIDFVFAYAERDETTAEPKGPALKKAGVPCIGMTRKIPLKDRALGRADAEIALDGDWWNDATPEERRALLDHELHHLVACDDTDDLDRPKIKLRQHDYDFGWFKIIAQRHGPYSMERQQAKRMLDDAGQYFWPALTADAGTGGRFTRLETTQG